jgi:hypothetical protein
MSMAVVFSEITFTYVLTKGFVIYSSTKIKDSLNRVFQEK